MQTTNVVAATARENAGREPLTVRKRVGSTTYVVSVRFSQTSRETMQDKILRLIEREVRTDACRSKMCRKRLRLPERSNHEQNQNHGVIRTPEQR
jgi:hypothetical protein